MKLKLYFLTLVIFLAIDAFWLGLFAPHFYQSQIGFLLTENPNWLAAGAFYLLFTAGLTYFIVAPGVRAGTLCQAALRGAFFGLLSYATYDLTNLATLAGWPVLITIVDMLWGTVLAGVTSAVSVWLGMKIVR